LNPLDFLKKIFSWLLQRLARAGEMLLGIILLILGLVLLAKSAGVSPAAVAGKGATGSGTVPSE
jgi:hypothetical protein